MQISPTFYPALDAVLNGSSAVLIGSGLYFIKRGREQAHKRMMLAAFATSTLFLISYLYYHLVLRAGVLSDIERFANSVKDRHVQSIQEGNLVKGSRASFLPR